MVKKHPSQQSLQSFSIITIHCQIANQKNFFEFYLKEKISQNNFLKRVLRVLSSISQSYKKFFLERFNSIQFVFSLNSKIMMMRD